MTSHPVYHLNSTGTGTTMLFPVTGASGVYKKSKSVVMIFGPNGQRSVSMYKSLP